MHFRGVISFLLASSTVVAAAAGTKKEKEENSLMASYHGELTTVHSILRRATDQIIKYGRNVTDLEVPNFLGFVSAYVYFLHSHHSNEDDIVFPLFQEQGFDMKPFESDHEEFSKIIDSLMATTNSSSSSYNGDELVDLVIRLKNGLFPHLEREENLSTLEQLISQNFTDSMISEMNERIMAKVQKEDASLVLPLLFYHMTEEESAVFGKKFPWFLRKIIFPFIIAKKHKGYWKYSFNPPKPSKFFFK